MGKFGAFVAGAVIPTLFAVGTYSKYRELQAAYRQVEGVYTAHMQDEASVLEKMDRTLTSGNHDFSELTRTVLELSAECDRGEAVQDALGIVKSYRDNSKALRQLIDTQQSRAGEYHPQGKQTGHAAREELEKELVSLR